MLLFELFNLQVFSVFTDRIFRCIHVISRASGCTGSYMGVIHT